jgi:UDP-2,3-diacylglucosamine pyrophosphatase LpxH
MSLHDELLQKLVEVADVQLVASLRDARIGFDDPHDLRVFVPDLHLVTAAKRGRYQYATNDVDLLAQVICTVATFRATHPSDTVVLFQMGDFLDLWRQEPIEDQRGAAARAIEADHAPLMDALFKTGLKPRFLLGNHDIELYRYPTFTAWDRRYYLPFGASPRIILMHGDALDAFEMDTARWFKQLSVYLFGPWASPTDYDIEQLVTLAHESHANKDYATQIQGTGVMAAPTSHLVIPARSNVQTARDHHQDGTKFLDIARKVSSTANQQFKTELRMMVIGHTHHPRIALHDEADGFFVLVDTGGFIESCKTPDGTITPNRQLTVLSENEVRIYQLGARAAAA